MYDLYIISKYIILIQFITMYNDKVFLLIGSLSLYRTIYIYIYIYMSIRKRYIYTMFIYVYIGIQTSYISFETGIKYRIFKNKSCSKSTWCKCRSPHICYVGEKLVSSVFERVDKSKSMQWVVSYYLMKIFLHASLNWECFSTQLYFLLKINIYIYIYDTYALCIYTYYLHHLSQQMN